MKDAKEKLKVILQEIEVINSCINSFQGVYRKLLIVKQTMLLQKAYVIAELLGEDVINEVFSPTQLNSLKTLNNSLLDEIKIIDGKISFERVEQFLKENLN